MRDGLPNRNLEDVNRNPFTLNIRHVGNAFDFKLAPLETCDGKTDLFIY